MGFTLESLFLRDFFVTEFLRRWCNRIIRCDPFKVYDKKPWRLSEFARNITVRSDLSGAATPDFTYPEPEIKLSSRLRGIYMLSSRCCHLYNFSHCSYDYWPFFRLHQQDRDIHDSGYRLGHVDDGRGTLEADGTKKPSGIQVLKLIIHNSFAFL
ncbi:unnamed protein product [Brassica oleracea var. botrytis]|uniref:Uncharacterized protein n=1 Tax=Brassica oleracea TaxID=3712 RepID=A0A3P6BP25_BRAOL|nr:unnamed protein product [Brassica oleracea]